MRHEKNINCAAGAVLAFVLAAGVTGALVTAFRMNIPHMTAVIGVCALSALVCSLCFRFRRGGLVLLGMLVPVSWWLFRGEETVQQTLYMLHSILRRFHGAYGWEIPRVVMGYANPGSMARPVAILGALVAAAVSAAVCRKKGIGLALIAAVLPFFLCFVVTDTVPDTKYLFLWMLGIFLLILTACVRQQSGAQSAVLAAMAALPAITALALLFWLVPRETYDRQPEQLQQEIANWVQELPGLWEEVSGEVAENISGVAQPNEVNLQSLGPRPDLDYPVMEVTAPQSGTLYLRGQDFDVYDGTGWTANRHRTEEFSRESIGMTPGYVSVVTRRVRDILYLPYYPGEQVTLVGGKLDNRDNLREYSFLLRTLPHAWRQQVEETWDAEPDGEIHFTAGQVDWDRRRYISLPADTLEWAGELTGTILDSERSATEIADAIGNYVRNSALYDASTGRMPGGETDFARWFLEESDTGYCVHFATAATVLLRAAGVEARYVEGYMVQTTAGTAVTVTQDSAHAWTEYYEPALDAWIILEATPADLTGEASRTEPPSAPEEQTGPTVPSEGPNPTQPTETAAPEKDPEQPPDGGEEQPFPWRWLLWGMPGMLAAAAVPAQRMLRLQYRRRKAVRSTVNDRALLLWQHAELAYRLLKETVPEELEDLARKAAYSRHGVHQEELERMEQAWEAAKEKLREKPWYEKILHQYFYALY